MPVRVLSLFGSYDFFAKSLPGMLMVVCIFPLLKTDSIPIPDLSEQFLVFVIILVIIWLTGTLLGEAVHSVAIHFEQIVAWAGKVARSAKDYLSSVTGVGIPRPTEPSPNQRRRDTSSKTGDSLTTRPFFLRVYFGSRRRLAVQYYNIYKWVMRRYNELIHIAWSHRNIFSTRLESPASSSFTQRYLIDFVRDELDGSPPFNADEVYTVVVSRLSNSQCERAFRFQSRFGFCRSMGVVLLIIGLTYMTVVEYPSDWLVPSALQYEPYLFSYLEESRNSVVRMISAILIFTAFLFFRASGDYKQRYIEYLASEFYVVDELLEDE